MSLTTVSLIDFKISSSSHHYEEQDILFKYLKNSLSIKSVPFSLNFNLVRKIKSEKFHVCFDIIVSPTFDRLIACSGSSLTILDKFKADNTDNDPILFSVKYDGEDHFHCLQLVNEMKEEFIYATTAAAIVKIRVRDLMENSNRLVWKCNRYNYPNIWGLDLMGNQVLVLDFNKAALIKVNRETGVEEESTPISIDNAFGIKCLSQDEILISNKLSLEIFKKQDNNWISKRVLAIPNCASAYSIFYEKESRLIYLSDTEQNTIVVVGLDDFSIKQTFEGEKYFARNFGLFVDNKTGFLYVATCKLKEILIFK